MELNKKEHKLSLDADKIDNAVLKRLIQEVRDEQPGNPDAYNRLHNRHNRTPRPRPQPTPEPLPERIERKTNN